MPAVTLLEHPATDTEELPFWTLQPTAYRYRAHQEPCEWCWLGDGRVAFHTHCHVDLGHRNTN